MGYKVGVLGATGMVGQRFLSLLSGHPWFETVFAAASEKSIGKTLGEKPWLIPGELPSEFKDMEIQPCKPRYAEECDIIFSALPSTVAKTVELSFARNGFFVASNASAYRRERDVALLVPEINPDHLDLIHIQRELRKWDGAIITNPNCTTTGLAITLKPLYDSFSLRKIEVTSMQALSGAGYNGVKSLAIIDNLIPFIDGEEEKVQWESKKILGRYCSGHIEEADIAINATCTRVNVRDGHILSVHTDLNEDISEIISVFEQFKGLPQQLALPSAPDKPIILLKENDRPQPLFDRDRENGFSVSVGRIRKSASGNIKYILLVHNTVRGAAGGAILNAELSCKKGFIGK